MDLLPDSVYHVILLSCNVLLEETQVEFNQDPKNRLFPTSTKEMNIAKYCRQFLTNLNQANFLYSVNILF